jgi:hypothetical protein
VGFFQSERWFIQSCRELSCALSLCPVELRINLDDLEVFTPEPSKNAKTIVD